MRKVGEFQEEKKALRFWNYLKERGMDSSLEKEDGELWLIWVDDEEKVEQAATAYGEFAENPDDPKFLSSKPLKKPEREEEERVDSAPKARGFEERRLREQWRRSERRLGPMTLSLIITTTCVFFVSLLTKQNPRFQGTPEPTGGFHDFQDFGTSSFPDRHGDSLRLYSSTLVCSISSSTCSGSAISELRLRAGRDPSS